MKTAIHQKSSPALQRSANHNPAWRILGRLPYLLCLALPLIAILPLQAQSTLGAIEGRVLNPANGNYLNNARITVEGTNHETLTNENGEYRLANVPAGRAVLKVAYSGLEQQTATVEVAPGQVVRRDFELVLRGSQNLSEKEIVKLTTFVVEATTLSAQASAINEQRQAPNIKNVVVFDEIGDLADGNIGEYLRYTPGLSLLSGPQVAVAISIRGMPSSGTLVMVDGAELSSPAADRSFDLTSTASASVDRIEVTKVPTPDLPANAVGGAINIIGRSGFSTPRRSLKLSAFGTYNSFDGLKPPSLSDRRGTDAGTNWRHIQPGFDLSYVQPLNKSLAFTVNAGSSRRYYVMEYLQPTWDMVRFVQTTAHMQPVLQANERVLGAATLDWKINAANSLRLNVQHTEQNVATRQNQFLVNFGANSTGGPTFTQGAATGVGSIVQTPAWGDREVGTDLAALRYVHAGAIWRIDAQASLSRSWDERQDLDHGFFRSPTNAQWANLVLRADGLDGLYSRTAPRLSGRDRLGQIIDPYNAAPELSLAGASSSQNRNKSWVETISANVGRDLETKLPLSVKTGASVRRQQKDLRTWARSWTFNPPGGAAGRLVRNFDFVDPVFSSRTFFNDSFQAQWISPERMYNLYRTRPEYFTLNETAAYTSDVTSSRKLEEVITAAYLRGDLKLFDNKLWLVSGVRWERTADHGFGPRNDIRATYVQDAAGNLVRDAAGRLIPVTTDPLARARLQYTARAAESRRSYDGYYPSLNASYSFSEALVARVAYARTIGRPALSEIIPGITVADPDAPEANRTITVVNTGLQPWSSNNYDLSLEAYHVKGAVVAASFFRKDLRNFFGSIRRPATADMLAEYGLSDDYLGYELITKTNFGAATITGIELSWRQSLLFLPAWAKGVQVFANGTSMDLSGPNANDFSGGAGLAGFSRRNINWGASYVRGRVLVKVNVARSDRVQQGRVAQSASVPANTFQYIAPRTNTDVSFEYRMFRNFSLYGSARSLTGGVKKTIRAAPSVPDYAQPTSYQNFGTLVTFGVKGDF